ncbi:plant cysteine oxidase 2-like [Olea europaea subsp. europaea]|nr:plant cysteine oxidase 2-like [Olea europaea subsp. europaea]
MTIEAVDPAEQRRSSRVEHNVDEVIKKKKKKKRKRCKRKVSIQVKRPVKMVSRTLQRLIDLCQQVFKGPGTVPSPSDVRRLRHILDFMEPEDVGLSRDLQFFQPKSVVVKENRRVSYATIYKCHNFSLCIFFLPATAVIPLHNHPGMTVFSKLLLGTMRIKSYDWADTQDSDNYDSPSKLKLARLKTNRCFRAPCETSVLYPTSGGNIHEFTAVTPCAVLDVLGPPYSKDDGRDCTYYRENLYGTLSNREEFTKTEDDGHRYGWFEEIEMPQESEMEGIPYLGPQIDESIS